MLLNTSVSDADILAETVKGAVCVHTNIVYLFIPVKIARCDDIEVLCMVCMFKLLTTKEV